MIQSPSKAHSNGSSVVADIVMLAVCAGVWLGSWGLLWVASFLAGGRPGAGPVEYPGLIFKAISADRRIVPWHWVAAQSVNPVGFAIVLGIGALLVAAGAMLAASGGKGLPLLSIGRGLSPSQKASGWASRGDLRPLTKLHDQGLPLGEYGGMPIFTDEATSVFVVGAPGSGKTASLIIPMLQWSEKMAIVVTSTKPDIIHNTIGLRSRIGEVLVFDPTNATGGLHNMDWTPLDGCRDLQTALRRGMALASAITDGGTTGGQGNLAYFEKSGGPLLAALLFVAETSGGTIVDVRRWLHNSATAFDRETGEFWGRVQRIQADGLASRSDLRTVTETVDGILERPEAERGSVFSTMQSVTQLYMDPEIAERAMSSSLDIKEFLSGPNTLYLCAPSKDAKRIAPLFNGVIGSLTDEMQIERMRRTHKSDIPLLLLLDEVANVSPLPNLDQLAAEGRDQGIVLVSVVQALSQVYERWGQLKGDTILQCHKCKVSMSMQSDPKTTEYFSKLIGGETYSDVTVTGTQRSTRVGTRQLMTPEQLRTMPTGSAVVIHGNIPPFILKLRSYYSVEWMRRASTLAWARGVRLLRHTRGAEELALVRAARAATYPGALRRAMWRIGLG